MSTAVKGLGSPEKHDGSSLRIGILHARWNTAIVSALVSGCRKQLLTNGVKEENIAVESVPGSWELPGATQRLYAASQVQASKASSSASGLISATADLLGSTSVTDLPASASTTKDPASINPSSSGSSSLIQPFDAIIAIGVLIKGETMHFEYIADAVSHGLMKVQLESGVPVVFGVLTVLNEEQGQARAGIAANAGHNHGEDWADAAVELGSKGRRWKEGVL